MFVGRGCLPISIGEKLPFGFGAKYRDMCRECGGDGKVEHNCSACRGVGYFQGVKCEACGATGKVEDACAFCGGSGKKPKD